MTQLLKELLIALQTLGYGKVLFDGVEGRGPDPGSSCGMVQQHNHGLRQGVVVVEWNQQAVVAIDQLRCDWAAMVAHQGSAAGHRPGSGKSRRPGAPRRPRCARRLRGAARGPSRRPCAGPRRCAPSRRSASYARPCRSDYPGAVSAASFGLPLHGCASFFAPCPVWNLALGRWRLVCQCISTDLYYNTRRPPATPRAPPLMATTRHHRRRTTPSSPPAPAARRPRP